MLKSSITVAETCDYLSVLILSFVFSNIAQNFSWTQGHSAKRWYFRDFIAECGCGIKLEPEAQMQFIEILIKREMFPSPISFFQVLRHGWDCYSTTNHHVPWCGSYVLQRMPLLRNSQKAGAWVTADCWVAQERLLVDTFHLSRKQR